MVFKRLTITLINILFPPLAVLVLCGPETDLIVNCLLFLAAVIPSHVHAFYISCTYFNRKRKARKGVYPGKWRWGIYSERVQNGGVSNREIARLKREMAKEKKVDVDYHDEEWGAGRSKSRTRRSGYDNGYGGEAQKLPGGCRTRTTEYQPDMQQVPGRSRSRGSGYDAQDVLSTVSTRRTPAH
jgi:uncharacterized membrane protein YqaE (UPF0057 family)